MKKNIKAFLLILPISLLSGCASLSGFDASNDFACKASPGVSCDSISGVYQNALENNLPSQKSIEKKSHQHVSIKREILGKPIKSGKPLFQRATALRVWFAPWEDSNQVLHDQAYSYLLIQEARWDIEHFKDVEFKKSFSINQDDKK